MYSPKVIAQKASSIESAYPIKLKEYGVNEIEVWVERLKALIHPDSTEANPKLTRSLTEEEQNFISNEIFMCKISYPYWATRYAMIKTDKGGLARLKFWESQEMLLHTMGVLEEQAVAILIINLKARQIGACLDPNTLVLTADLSWKTLDSLKEGDKLLSLDETGKKQPGKKVDRKLRIAVVEGKKDVFEPAYKLEFDNGEAVIATAKHRFLFRKRGGKQPEWRTVEKAVVGDTVRYITAPWEYEKTYEHGWFGGIIDGEGCLRGKNNAGSELTISQVDGMVWNEISQYLNTNKYTWRMDIDKRDAGTSSKLGDKPVLKACVGRMDQLFKLIGTTRPKRFIDKTSWWEGKSLPGRGATVQNRNSGWAKLVSITSLGCRRMVDLQTSTKTFIAEGFVSHNSTLSETVLTHKVINNHGITSLVASDEPAKSEFLFNMMERVYQHLPFYLRPHKKFHQKGMQLIFDTLDSHIYVDSGNKRTGGIGQGMTVHSGHLSELATWNNPEMIIEDLLPALLSGASPNTFFIMESTAKGKSGHWYNWWRAAKRKKFHDFIPVFIPWWSVTEKYSKDPVAGWTPSDRILKQAATIKANKGKELNIKQMYWWDKTYESHKETNELNKFFAEYASDDQEAFQLSGSTVFPTEILNDMLREAKSRSCALYEIQEKTVIK